MQKTFGRHYSSICRIIKEVFRFVDDKWKHLVTNSLHRFKDKFDYWNQCVIKKMKKINHGIVINRYRKVAIFFDGTRTKINKNKPDK